MMLFHKQLDAVLAIEKDETKPFLKVRLKECNISHKVYY